MSQSFAGSLKLPCATQQYNLCSRWRGEIMWDKRSRGFRFEEMNNVWNREFIFTFSLERMALWTARGDYMEEKKIWDVCVWLCVCSCQCKPACLWVFIECMCRTNSYLKRPPIFMEFNCLYFALYICKYCAQWQMTEIITRAVSDLSWNVRKCACA